MRAYCCGMAMLVALAGLVGCGDSSSTSVAEPASAEAESAGGVGIIDLDVVARQLGRDAQIVAAIKQQQESLNKQFQALQASYVDQFNAKKQEYGEQISVAQAQHLTAIKGKINSELAKVKHKAETGLTQHRAAIIKQFQEEVRPFARQIADERGLSLIVPKNESLIFSVDPTVDISTAVADRMKASMAQNPPATLPSAAAEAQPLPGN